MQVLWRICLFGGLRVFRESAISDPSSPMPQGVLTRFRTQQTGALLAFMACHRRASFSREELIGAIWPEDEPESARTKLRMALSSLRRQLEPPGIAPGVVITADRVQVALNRSVIKTDVSLFESECLEAERSTAQEEQMRRLQAAVALYSGELLPGFYDDWITADRVRLHSSLIRILTRLAPLLEETGDFAGAIHCMERRTKEEPLDEEAHVALIRLYHATGEPHAALRQYRFLEHILATEMGQRPAQLLSEILAGIPVTQRPPTIPLAALPPAPSGSASRTEASQRPVTRLKPRKIAAPLPASPPGDAATNLPPQVTRFFGREEELAFIESSLLAMMAEADGGARILTLVGAGGAGKTRLAIESGARWAQRHSAELLYVPLSGLASAAGILDSIAALAACPASQEDTLTRIEQAIANRPYLLILDNLEHLGDEGAEVVGRLVAALPRARFLITSRHALGLSSERLSPIAPLPVPRFAGRPEWLVEFASVQLFIDRAQAVRPDFQIGPRNASEIVDLCQLLDGLPLALELAATWTGMMTPRQMLARFRDRIDLLASRKRDLPERQRTLYAAMDWSYNLLTPDLQSFFSRLSVFRGGWSTAAAEAVCGPGASLDCFDALTILAERSLLEPETHPIRDEPRFYLLSTVRDYAWQKLSPDERTDASRLHARCFQQFAEDANYNLDGADAPRILNSIEREMPNFTAALDWLDETPEETETALKLGGSLYWFWWTRGYIAEGRRQLARILRRPDADQAPRPYCHALRGSAMLARYQSDYDAAKSFEERCIEIARRREDWGMLAMALGSLGNTEKQLGNGETARALYLESLEHARRLDLRKIAATLLGNLGNVARDLKIYDEAAQYYRDALEMHRPLGFRQAQTVVLCDYADLLILMGKGDEAHALLSECLPICMELEDKPAIAHWLDVFAHLERFRSRPERAILLHFAAAELREQIASALPPLEQQAIERMLQQLAFQTGPETFERLREEGRSCSVDYAVRVALEQEHIFSTEAPTVRS